MIPTIRKASSVTLCRTYPMRGSMRSPSTLACLILLPILLNLSSSAAQEEPQPKDGPITVDPITTNPDDAISVPPISTGNGDDRRLLKIEKLRNRMFNPAIASAEPSSSSSTSSSPAVQISLFKEQARQRMGQRLTEIFEETRKAQIARQKAKDLVRERAIRAFEQIHAS